MALTHIGPFVYKRFAPTLAPLTSAGKASQSHTVLIVGGGPVGLTSALGLARWGVRSVVIEADDSVCEGSRAACISRRSLEILDRLGVAQPFIEKGLAWTTGRSFYGDQEVFRLEMPSDGTHKYPPMINLQQYYIEQFLLDEIDKVNEQNPGFIEVRWQSRVTALHQDEQGVQVGIECPLGGYSTRADWLLACDGGQSFVRTSLGQELRGVAYQGRYAIVDIELASQAPTERRAWFDPPWAKGTTILMHRQPDNIWRIDYQLSAHQDAQTVLSPEHLSQFVQTHLDAIGEGHLPWKPVWTSIYRAGAMTLDAYRHGRILFAGNSAHAMPIFGVRGLNSGLDDADNLIWKLAAVIHRQAGDRLLDTYSAERIQAFHINAASAMRSTEFMTPPHRGFELMREAALSLAGRHKGIANLVNPRQSQAVVYEKSDLSSADEGQETGPMLGEAVLDAQVNPAQYLTDLLWRDGFTLIGFGTCEDGPQVASVTRSPDWNALPCAFIEVKTSSQLSRLYGARDGSAYLVRPDGHVCARWFKPALGAVLNAIQIACQLQEAAA
ncbi:MAG: FAD-dependent monooxygenase [Limnohabitans sp.]